MRMLKADLPKGERAGEKREMWPELGECLDAARRDVGWTLDQLAAELPPPDPKQPEKRRDSKQVARWIRGEERIQVDAVFAVEALRAPFVIALAKLAAMQVETTIRRTA